LDLVAILPKKIKFTVFLLLTRLVSIYLHSAGKMSVGCMHGAAYSSNSGHAPPERFWGCISSFQKIQQSHKVDWPLIGMWSMPNLGAESF